MKKNTPIFSFEAPEYYSHNRGPLWYSIALVCLTILVGYGFWSGGWTFAVALMVFAGVYALHRMKEPKRYQVTITETGIMVGPYTLPYKNLKGFSVQTDLFSRKRIVLISKKRFQGEISVPLEDGHIESVRGHLLPFLEEETEHSQKFSDLLVQLLKL